MEDLKKELKKTVVKPINFIIRLEGEILTDTRGNYLFISLKKAKDSLRYLAKKLGFSSSQITNLEKLGQITYEEISYKPIEDLLEQYINEKLK